MLADTKTIGTLEQQSMFQLRMMLMFMHPKDQLQSFFGPVGTTFTGLLLKILYVK